MMQVGQLQRRALVPMLRLQFVYQLADHQARVLLVIAHKRVAVLPVCNAQSSEIVITMRATRTYT